MHKPIIGPPGKYANEHFEPYVEGGPHFIIGSDGSNQWGIDITSYDGNISFPAIHRENGPAQIYMRRKNLVNEWRLYGKYHNLYGYSFGRFDEDSKLIECSYHVNGETQTINSFPDAVERYRRKILTEAAIIAYKENSIKPILNNLINLKPDKADKIKVIMDMCAEWGL